MAWTRAFPLLAALLLAMPQVALAADGDERPSVRKEWPESVTSSAAVFRGYVDTHGHAATCWFSWGTTANYDRTTAPQALGGADGWQTARALVDGLAPATRYHYRLECHSVAGSASSGNVPFHTLRAPDAVPGSPPAVTTGPATEVNATAATLTGTVTPGASEATCTFELQADGAPVAGGATHIVPASADPLPLEERREGLQPGIVHTYHLRCANADGVASGASATFTTGSASSLEPPTLRIEPPREVTDTSAVLVGEVLALGASSATCWFLVEPGAPTPERVLTAPGVLEEPLAGLAPDTLHRASLRCVNEGASAQTPAVEFRTSAPPPTGLPPDIRLEPATNLTPTSAELAAHVTTDAPATCSFALRPHAGDAPAPVAAPVGASRVAAVWTGLAAASTYAFSLTCVNEHGARTSGEGSFTTSAEGMVGPRLEVAALAPRETGPTYAIVGGRVVADASGVCRLAHGAGDAVSVTNETAFLAGETLLEARLDGLHPDTPYVYAWTCEVEGARATSGEGRFRTGAGAPGTPLHVVTLPVARTEPTQARLVGRLDAVPRALCGFELATPEGARASATRFVEAGEFLLDVGALTAGTTYAARAVCEDGGTLAAGGWTSFTTGAAVEGAPPAVVTGRVASVSASTATLTGSVDSPDDASCAFEVSDGATTRLVGAGNGTGAREVVAEATGLSPARAHEARLVCANAAGVASGGLVAFTTGGSEGGHPSVVATLLPSDIQVDAATLRARVTTASEEGALCRFEFTTSSFAFGGVATADVPVAAAQTQLVETRVEGLRSGVVYRTFVRCESIDSHATALGDIVTFATPADHHVRLEGRLLVGAAGARAGDCMPNLGAPCLGHEGVTFTRHYLGPGYEGAPWSASVVDERTLPEALEDVDDVDVPARVRVCFEDGHYRQVGSCTSAVSSGFVPEGARVVVVALEQGLSARYAVDV